jgi:multiple sugar transport system substrate-binding protein
MLANALGAEPFSRPHEAIAEVEGMEALELLRELVQLSAPGALDRNPIRTWQLLADSESVAYCPFAYGYSNYSRAGYAANVLRVGGLVRLKGKLLRSTLGGAGLALTRSCKQSEQALAYAVFTASPAIQKTLYMHAGGQPGHRAAWLDPAVNAAADDFFANTLSTLDSAWVRPRFPGFIGFQDEASTLVHQYLRYGGSGCDVICKMNEAFIRAQRIHA